MREIVKANFIRCLYHCRIFLPEIIACFAYSHLSQKINIGLSCSMFKKPAKGTGRHVGYSRYFLQPDRPVILT